MMTILEYLGLAVFYVFFGLSFLISLAWFLFEFFATNHRNIHWISLYADIFVLLLMCAYLYWRIYLDLWRRGRLKRGIIEFIVLFIVVELYFLGQKTYMLGDAMYSHLFLIHF